MPNPMLDQDRVALLQAREPIRHVLVPAWPRAQKELPQVEVEVSWVRFSTLNHRTRAEQHREMHLTNQPDLFKADPLGPAAQEAQYRILRSQEGFKELKDDLRERGQQEPAIITAEGVLINGNRRTAALRSLYQDDDWAGARYVQCLVLPQDAQQEELVDLEAELQVARDFKQEYSWINEAFLIEELYDREGKDWTRVARRMHRTPVDVQALHAKLQQVHQLVDLAHGARLHVDFVANESAFDELAKHIKNKAPAEADSVRSTYFLGTLANVEYRKLRHLRRPDAAALVRREIERDPALKPVIEAASSVALGGEDGDLLDDLLGEVPPAQPLNDLLGLVASRTPDQSLPLGDGAMVPARQVLSSLRSAITAAADDAEEEARDQSTAKAPLVHADKAIGELRRVLKNLPSARTRADWDASGFADRVIEIKRLLEAVEGASA
ncbi:ParB/RepB/Spo0J family partition protein [Micromonospora sp. WMMD882]|uniref:ParB/RepB/Spo0J family partition protein n=1 Tax=Micromonospora sp. WMMD882 TaxID=3015151 RepID=UPI00248AF621|nr:ParB/RepB/Spo0J family partition protein [Micromonospora sp. WMMD882]WBB77756.1 ParB/RepB/Spo0J family partition protein [Micromonospora sp. WMMD882]